jgi:hypothetical protein
MAEADTLERDAVADEKPETVAYHARAALKQANGNLEEAARILESNVRTNERLWRALLEPLVRDACYFAVSKQQREVRERVWSPAPPRPGVTGESRARILAAANLLMFPLPSGKFLGEASRGEVAEAAEFYSKQSRDMAHKARWLSLVSQSVPPGKTVKVILTHERLRELQQEVANG